MRRRSPALALALLGAALAPVVAQRPTVPVMPTRAVAAPIAETELRSWSEATAPAHIVGPVYYVGTRGLAAYLIRTSNGLVLVDGALPRAAPLIEASIRQLGFRVEDIRLLIFGHAHVDHVGTLAYFKKRSGAIVAVMDREVDLLRSGGAIDFHYGGLPGFTFTPVVADRVLHDGATLRVGDVTLTALLTPGHTRGSTSWVADVGDGERRYRVVFPDGTSLNPGYRLVKDPSYPGIVDDYRRALRVQEGIQADVWLPSHASFFDFERRRARASQIGVAAWVDPVGYHRFVAERRRALDQWVAKESSSLTIGDNAWRLVRVVAGGRPLALDPGSEYVAAFGGDGRAKLRDGCHRGVGNWRLTGWNAIRLNALALARSACPPRAIGDRLVRDWGTMRRAIVAQQRLTLTAANGTRYEFAPFEGGLP